MSSTEYKVDGYSVIYTVHGTQLAYSLSKTDKETGEIINSNIRKSTPVLASNKELMDAIEVINKYLYDKENTET